MGGARLGKWACGQVDIQEVFMELCIVVHYTPAQNERLMLCGSCKQLGEWHPEASLPFHAVGSTGMWICLLVIEAERFECKLVAIHGNSVRWEEGPNRVFLHASPGCAPLLVRVSWQVGNIQPCILDVSLACGKNAGHLSLSRGTVRTTFLVFAPSRDTVQLAVVGSCPTLGSWRPEAAFPLSCLDDCLAMPSPPCSSSGYWLGQLDVPRAEFPLSFKFISRSLAASTPAAAPPPNGHPAETPPVTWESGPNRTLGCEAVPFPSSAEATGSLTDAEYTRLARLIRGGTEPLDLGFDTVVACCEPVRAALTPSGVQMTPGSCAPAAVLQVSVLFFLCH